MKKFNYAFMKLDNICGGESRDPEKVKVEKEDKEHQVDVEKIEKATEKKRV
jgi:hypothetical protein